MESLGIDRSFCGDDAVASLKAVFEINDIENVVDAGDDSSVAKCNESRSESPGCPSPWDAGNVHTEISFDD